MRTFLLVRRVDLTGVSGTGEIAEGVEFTDGSIAIRWRGSRSSICIWKSIEDLISVHGHNGTTKIVWT